MGQNEGKVGVGPESCQWPNTKVESLHFDIKIVKCSVGLNFTSRRLYLDNSHLPWVISMQKFTILFYFGMIEIFHTFLRSVVQFNIKTSTCHPI